jgi:phenylpropionate dioxygenase-like ring-hydroxylating dioxygenase large terminal subunit
MCCNAFSTSNSIVTSTNDVISSKMASSKSSSSVLPLQQNWWPVALVNTLNEKSPNAERLLNKDLVLWHDGEGWICMDDMCAHRFAPLSEGRVFQMKKEEANNRRCLSCSYHGWEFDSQGFCTKIPQTLDPTKSAKNARVSSYPVQIRAGIVWVWPDESSSAFAETVPLPISPMLQQWHKEYPQSAYQREIPYGYELLAENVIDLSHLPYAHHQVLSSREHGVHLPFKMLSLGEKEKVWEKESSSIFANATESDKVLPTHQVEIRQGRAQYSDPIFTYNLMGTNKPDENSTSHIGFYPPSHIRYHRTPMSGLSSNTELFLCPQSAGKCRVIIFNPFEGGMKKLRGDAIKSKNKFDLLSKIGNYLLRKVILKKYMGVENHLMVSSVFDGDNVFLALQGERLAKNRLDYTDYLVPSSADTLSKIFRKWLDRAAEATRQTPCKQANNIVEAAVGVSLDGASPYTTSFQRSKRELLDRYNSHTKSCPICSQALSKLEQRRKILNCALPTLLGATGASLIACILSVCIVETANLPSKLIAKMFGSSFVMSVISVLLKTRTEKAIQQFYYVDHSHQD